jgi:hypothetical protein
MSKIFSVIFFTTAILIGQQIVFSYNNHSSVAKADPGNPTEKWFLKTNGDSNIVKIFKGKTSKSSDGTSEDIAAIDVRIFPKQGSRPHTLITIVESQLKEQFSGKGKYRAIYTGTFDGSEVSGTYYDNDGGSGSFTLTK